ncbi:MAG: lipoate--protein ligase [Bacteroidales bacterium]|nr:lipoate--protein ligase [Bacteroidales bacterium]
MLCIPNQNTDPYFNLATEEYILKNFKENCFVLWRSRPSIIIGKHQNALAEINLNFVQEQNIPVVRRLSGGGTVFHDLGNLNFSFFQNVEDNENLVDFKRYTKPILEVLHDLGVDAKFEGRNDIMIEGKKISGNAEHIFKKRVLHHGTLLFSSEISNLSQALKVNPLIYQDKGVKSVRSRVTNIIDHLSEKITVKDFYNKILNHIVLSDKDAVIYEFTNNDIEHVNRLVNEKYKTWEWNFGYSPKYNFEKSQTTSEGTINVQLSVEKGFIKDVNLACNFIDEKIVKEIELKLKDIRHEPAVVSKELQNFDLSHDKIEEISTTFF